MSGLNCSTAVRVVALFGALSAPLNALLFLLRVVGVYHHSRLVMCGFTVLWLSTLASIVAPWGYKGSNIGPTQYCIPEGTAKYNGVSFVLLTVFDTTVFIAITLRVMSVSMLDTWTSRRIAFVQGRGLGRLTGALLQTGQLYYS